MSVIIWKEIAERGGSIDDENNRDNRRKFFAVTNNRSDGPNTVRAYASCPRVGQRYETGNDSDPFCFVKKVNVEQIEKHPFAWEVDVEYSSRPRTKCSETLSDDPLDQPPKIRGLNNHYQRALQKDEDGKAIVDSAGLPYDPPQEIEDVRHGVVITRNEASLNMAQIVAYNGATNSDSFWGLEKEQARVWIEWEIAYCDSQETCYSYAVKTYTIEIRNEQSEPKSFRLELLDAGFSAFARGAGPDDQPRRIKFGDEYPHNPVPLDGAGGILAPGAEKKYNIFHPIRRKPFAALNLPNPESLVGIS